MNPLRWILGSSGQWKEELVSNLTAYWESLGGDASVTDGIERDMVAGGASKLRQLRIVAVDKTLPVNVRKAAVACGVKFGDPQFLTFLGQEFINGKRPGALYAAWQEGDSDSGAQFALYREAKEWLERSGYRVESRQ